MERKADRGWLFLVACVSTGTLNDPRSRQNRHSLELHQKGATCEVTNLDRALWSQGRAAKTVTRLLN